MLDKKHFLISWDQVVAFLGWRESLESRPDGEGKHVLIRLRNKTYLFKMRKRKITKHLEKKN